MDGRRVITVAAAALALASGTAGCATQVHGRGQPDLAAGPQMLKDSSGTRIELTPLAEVRGKSGDGSDVLRIELRMRNAGNATYTFRPAGAAVADAAGKKASLRDEFQPASPEGDPQWPDYPEECSPAPGETLVSYLSFGADAGFRPDTLTVEGLTWKLAGLPAQPVPATVAAPPRAVPAGQPVTLDGTDLTAEPGSGQDGEFGPVRLQARVTRLVDPATGYDPGDGYRFVAVQLQIGNVGPRPYWAVPPADMTIVDTAGHPYEATPYLQGDQFPNASITTGATHAGLVGFLVPQHAKLAYVGLSLFKGTEAAHGRWTFG